MDQKLSNYFTWNPFHSNYLAWFGLPIVPLGCKLYQLFTWTSLAQSMLNPNCIISRGNYHWEAGLDLVNSFGLRTWSTMRLLLLNFASTYMILKINMFLFLAGLAKLKSMDPADHFTSTQNGLTQEPFLHRWCLFFNNWANKIYNNLGHRWPHPTQLENQGSVLVLSVHRLHKYQHQVPRLFGSRCPVLVECFSFNWNRTLLWRTSKQSRNLKQ